MNEETAYKLFQYMMQRHSIDPASLAFLLDTAETFHPQRRRAYQAGLLMQTFSEAAALAQACNWNGVVVLRDGEVFVDQDGALLQVEPDARLFRKHGISQAAPMIAELHELGIEPRTVLDLGANVGEIAVYLAYHLPNARVVAFEPAPENLASFERNLSLQREPLRNLELIREAVSDRSGQIEFTIGAGSLNTAIVADNLERLQKHKAKVVSVPTDTLFNYCEKLGIDEIDFMKVDVEGGEPLLSDSIARMPGRIHAAFVEISRYNSIPAYLEMVAAFDRAGLRMVNGKTPIADPEDWIRTRLASGPATNVWFVRSDHLPA